MNESRRNPVRQPNAQIFNGYCYACNKFGHMASQCRSKTITTRPSFSSQCFNCYKYGHKSSECRIMMHNLHRDIKCYACNRFGHVANQCKSRKTSETIGLDRGMLFVTIAINLVTPPDSVGTEEVR